MKRTVQVRLTVEIDVNSHIEVAEVFVEGHVIPGHSEATNRVVITGSSLLNGVPYQLTADQLVEATQKILAKEIET